jgi:hypothetical protein
VPIGPWPNIRTTYPPPWWQLFIGEDPMGAEGDRYDFDAAFERTCRELQQSEPLTYFSEFRGLLVTRSGWDRDALMLYFEPRHVPGGHTRASRNDFVVCGLGRKWSDRPPAVEATSEFQSLVLIDGKGQGKHRGRCPAGRTVALADGPQATFAAGDAAWAYGHVLVSADHEPAEPIGLTPNDSRLAKSRLPWMSRPWSFLPNWATGCKPAPRQPGGPAKDPGGHGYWIPYNPVQYAYRTVGLVRGAHPYVLVVDDLRKDDEEHEYAWQMQIQEDLKVEKALCGGAQQGRAAIDLTLRDDQGRCCLVRVFEAGDRPADAELLAASGFDVYRYEHRGVQKHHHRLLLPVRSVVGRFKVLIFPYRESTHLPQTTFSADGTRLTVKAGAHTDLFRFTTGEDGRTRVALQRDGSVVAEVK